MNNHARVVVIGGGVVGVSMLYHLAKKGWTDAVLIERKELTSGSTWHAAGLFPLFNRSYSVGQVHKYSVKFYKELEEETGITESEIKIDPVFRFTLQYEVQYKRTKGKKKLKEVVIFLACLQSTKDIEITEHEGFQWFDWNPPHDIQANTINPLLRYLENHLESKSSK